MAERAGGGRSLTVIAEGGAIELEHAGDMGLEWWAAGPKGEAIAPLREALLVTAADGTDPLWIDAVVSAIEREFSTNVCRSMLLVKRGGGTWYHASLSSNRGSILEHGLDWRRMTGPGIAGNTVPEYPGVFLCADLWSAQFFVRIGARFGPIDIWEVQLDGQWLEGAPDAGGGGDDSWMICPQPIRADKLHLAHASQTTEQN